MSIVSVFDITSVWPYPPALNSGSTAMAELFSRGLMGQDALAAKQIGGQSNFDSQHYPQNTPQQYPQNYKEKTKQSITIGVNVPELMDEPECHGSEFQCEILDGSGYDTATYSVAIDSQHRHSDLSRHVKANVYKKKDIPLEFSWLEREAKREK
jgi:hypothetical protein